MKSYLILLLLGMLLAFPAAANVDFEYTYEGQTLHYFTTSAVGEVVVYNNRSNYITGEVIIPETVEYEGVRYTVSAIDENGFSACGEMTSISIPRTITTIGNSAFGHCPELLKAEFASVEAICNMKYGDSYANPLSYAHNLWIAGKEIKDIVIPETVSSIGEEAFFGASALTSVTIGNSVTSIGKNAFKNCSALESVKIGNSVKSIGNQAFYECIGLKNIEFGSTVDTIGERAFYNCKSLTTLSFPNSLTTICDRAFQDCSGLASISLGNSVKSVGVEAFNGCRSIIKAEFASLESMSKINYLSPTSNPIYFTQFILADGEVIRDLVIPETVTSIGERAFYNCSSLTSIVIPNSVTSIGEGAFSNCSGVTSLAISDSVVSIGSQAFAGCSGLTSVRIPNSVISIGGEAFSSCWRMTSVSIGNSVALIGERAFAGCNNLTKAEFANVETMCKIEYGSSDSNPLYSAHHLWIGREEVKDIIIPYSVTTIGKYAFSGCSGLASIRLPGSITSIGDYAFEYCTGIKEVYYNSENPIGGDSSIFMFISNDATLYVPERAVDLCQVMSPWKYFNKIQSYAYTNGIGDVLDDSGADAPYDVFDIKGVKIGLSIDSLAPGAYFLRQGRTIKKIAIL